jgi:all-trans-retinol dehydrogenase (NAD+)
MFEGVKTRFAFLVPILKPEYVATQIVKSVANRKRHLVMPKFVFTVFLCRVLPVPLFDWIMDFLGFSKSMDEFTGRSGGH